MKVENRESFCQNKILENYLNMDFCNLIGRQGNKSYHHPWVSRDCQLPSRPAAKATGLVILPD